MLSGGSLLDADHPKTGVNLPCRSTPGGEASFVHEAGSRGPEEGWIPVLAQTTEILSHRHTYRLVYRVYWAGSGERRPVGRIASRLSAIEPTGDKT